ncbi:MAG TPA: PEP-CTERM sorting domain-containing protein [Verrucomicrobiae bacterium]|nr:PEP-CTERM sorting domain-containing protein [Verrucomicrobiae bacterium]
MKKALVGSILGLAMTVATSYGQGKVFFNTYVGTVYSPVTYANPVGNGATHGGTVGAGFFAELYYGIGSGLGFNDLTKVADSKTAVGTQVAGYVTGGIVNIPGYTSGPITFAVVCFNGDTWETTMSSASPTAYATLLPTVWTEPEIASGQNPAGTFSQNVPAITVSLVPEPSSFALLGLGSAALLALRRRK